jgi:hypothetical protein
MKIMVESPDGPRSGAEPNGGINNARSLVKSLLITLAVEQSRGNARIVLSIDLEHLEPQALVEIARSIQGMTGGHDHAG